MLCLHKRLNPYVTKSLDPFSCDCGLAWLIRDNPNLLKATNGATCANTTRFEDLNPGGYLECGVF